MGWAARNKFKGNYDPEQCGKCCGTGIRGHAVDPFTMKKTPIKCKCVFLKEIEQKRLDELAKKEAESDSPVPQLAEGTGLEPAQ